MASTASPESRIAELDLEISRAASELQDLETRWRPPLSVSHPLEKRLTSIQTGAMVRNDPRPRLAAKRLMEHIEATREKVATLRLERAHILRAGGPGDAELAAAEAQYATARDEQKSAYSRYLAARKERFRLKGTFDRMSEGRRLLTKAIAQHEREQQVASEARSCHAADVLALERYAVQLVETAPKTGELFPGLAAYVHDLQADAA